MMPMTLINPATTNPAVVTVASNPCRRTTRVNCLASSVISTQQLRSELDQLHSEAEMARNKANSARLRLMRLSEAAEKLQRQAAISVQTGQENYARDLLFQKKKIMQALEKSKRRIELLDELSAKLNEAISSKESQLIGNINLDLEDTPEAAPTICIAPSDSEKSINSGEDINLQVHTKGQCNNQSMFKSQITDKKPIQNENRILDNLRDLSSYEEFLEHLDGQLSIIEAELAILIRLSALVLESEEMTQKSKVHQTLEILESIRSVRERIKIASQTFNASDSIHSN